jgi:hypothetical protein
MDGSPRPPAFIEGTPEYAARNARDAAANQPAPAPVAVQPEAIVAPQFKPVVEAKPSPVATPEPTPVAQEVPAPVEPAPAVAQKPRVVVPAPTRPAVDVQPVVEPTPAPAPTAEAKPAPVEAKPVSPDVDPVTGKKLPQGIIEARKTADALIAAGLGDTAAAKNAVAQVNRWQDQNGRPKSYQTKQGELGQQPVVTPTERPIPAAEPIKRSKAIQDAIDQADKLEKSLAGATEKDRTRIERQLKLRRDQVNADDVRNGRKPTYGETEQPALPVQAETPVAVKATTTVEATTTTEAKGTTWNGQNVQFTGNTKKQKGGIFYEFQFKDGEKKGQMGYTNSEEFKAAHEDAIKNPPPPIEVGAEVKPKEKKVLSKGNPDEPASVQQARRVINGEMERSGGKRYDKALDLVEQYESDQKLAKYEMPEDLDKASDQGIEDFLKKHEERVAFEQGEGMDGNKAENDFAKKVREYYDNRMNVSTNMGDVIKDLRGLMNRHGIKLPTIPKWFPNKHGEAYADAVKGIAPDLFAPPPMLRRMVSAETLKDPHWRAKATAQVEGMIERAHTALSELGWTQLDPSLHGGYDPLLDLLTKHANGEATYPHGGVGGADRTNPRKYTPVEKKVSFLDSDTSTGDTFVNESNQSELFGPKQVEFKLDANGNVESVKPAVNADAKPTEVQQARKRKTIQQGEEIAANKAEPAKGDNPAVDRIHRIELPGGKFGAVVEHADAGSLRSGLDTVQTPADVAHVTGEWFAQRPQEVVAVVTADKNGKILGITRITTGTHTAAMVPQGIVTGAALGTPGATKAWIVHNHPSGRIQLSSADMSVNNGTANILKKSGIEYGGLFAIAKNKYSFVDTNGNVTQGADVPQIARTKTIPITERSFTQNDTIGPRMDKPSASIPFVKSIFGNKTGILLLNNLLDPVGSIEMTPDKMEKLRQKGGLDTLLPAIERANAVAMIAHVGDGMDVSQRKSIAENLQKLSSASGNLDTVDMIGDNKSYSSEIPPTFASGSNIRETSKSSNNEGTNKQTKIEAWADAKLKESQTRFNTGVDPEIAVALAIKGVAHAGRAAGDFVKWSKAMVDEFGNGVKPHLEAAWEKLKNLPDLQAEAAAHALVRDEAGKPALDIHAAIAEEALKQDAAKEVVAAAASDKTPTVNTFQKAINSGPVAFFRAVGSRMRSLAEINPQSPAMKEAVEAFVSTPGKTTQRDFLTAHSNQVKAFANRIETAMNPIAKLIKGMSPEAQRNLQIQMIKAIESNANVGGHLGSAIKEIKAVLSDMHTYANESGLKVGEVKDYFPRKVEANLVIKNPAGFVAAAEKAYEAKWRREAQAEASKAGLSAPEPTSKDRLDFRNKAIAWKDAIVLNKEGWNFEKGIFENTKPGKEENFQKEREFTKEEAKHFEDYRNTNIWKILASHVNSTVKQSELARRLGADGEKYLDLKQRMKQEGVPPEHVNSFEEYVKNMIGYTPPKDIGINPEVAQTVMNASNLLTTLKYLAKTPLLVAAEPAGTAHHTGETFSAPLIVGRNLIRLANIMRRASPKAISDANAMVEQQYGKGHDLASALALELGITSAHGPFMDGASGYMPDEFHENTGKMRELMNKVHSGMFLDAAETAKRESGVNEGMRYLQRLVDHSTGNNTLSKIFEKAGISTEKGMFDTSQYGTEKLKGLGIPEAEHADFADFVNGLNKMKPTDRFNAIADKENPMAGRYRNAVELFTKAAVVQTTTGSRAAAANSSHIGRALFMLNTYSNEYALQHREALYNEALRLTNKDGGNTSAGERLMAAKHLAALPMTMAMMYGVGQIYKAMNGQLDDKGKKAMFGLPHLPVDIVSSGFRTGISGSGLDMVWKTMEREQLPLPVVLGPLVDVSKGVFEQAKTPGSNAANKAILKTGFSSAVAPAVNLGLTQATNAAPGVLKAIPFAAQQVMANPQTAKAVGEAAGESSQPKSAQTSKSHPKKK